MVTEERLERVVVELRALAEGGLLADVDVRGVHRFSLRVLLPELGLGSDQARAQGLQATRLLIPRATYQALRTAERRCRAALEAHSLPLFGVGSFRYVPATAWTALQEAFAREQAGLRAVVERMAADYPSLREAALQLARRVATEAWRSPVVRRSFPDAVTFRAVVVERVERRFPTAEEVRAIRAELRVARLVTVADLAEEEARRQAAEAALQEARARLRVSQAAEEAMRQTLLLEARRKAQEALTPFEEYLASLRTRIHQEAVGILESLQRQDPQNLNPRTLQRCLRMVETFRRLALLPDPDLEQEIARLARAARAVRPGGRRTRPAPEAQAAARALVQALEEVVDASRPRTRGHAVLF